MTLPSVRALAAALTTMAVLATSGCGDSEKTAEKDAGTKDAAAAGASFVDDVLTTGELRIEITDHRVIQPGEEGNEAGGKPIIAFSYTLTNLAGDDVTPMDFIYNFEAYQGEGSGARKLEPGAPPGLDALTNQDEAVEPGGTLDSAASYELEDSTTPVQLVASDGAVGDEVGRITYGLE